MVAMTLEEKMAQLPGVKVPQLEVGSFSLTATAWTVRVSEPGDG